MKMTTQVYDAVTVANYIVISSWKRGTILTQQKLQNCLYCLQALFLVKKRLPCFYDIIRAEKEGPVVPTVAEAINKKPFQIISVRDVADKAKKEIEEEDKKLIDEFMKAGITFSSKEIQKQVPWIMAYSNRRTNIIDWGQLEEYFS